MANVCHLYLWNYFFKCTISFFFFLEKPHQGLKSIVEILAASNGEVMNGNQRLTFLSIDPAKYHTFNKFEKKGSNRPEHHATMLW